MTGFGGAEGSTFVADPAHAADKVGTVIKGVDTEVWAGKTISTLAGQAIPAISFSATNTVTTVRVWSPDGRVPVRLKVDNAADGKKSVVAEATTTAARGWQAPTFASATRSPTTSRTDLRTAAPAGRRQR